MYLYLQYKRVVNILKKKESREKGGRKHLPMRTQASPHALRGLECVVFPTQMGSQLPPQCHHLGTTTPLHGAQLASSLQFPEHLLRRGLDNLGVIFKEKLMSVSPALSTLESVQVTDSDTEQTLGTGVVGANKTNRIPSLSEFTHWEGRQREREGTPLVWL